MVADYVAGCNDEQVAFRTCVAATPPGAASWTCAAPDQTFVLGSGPQSVPCADEQDAVIQCLYYGYGYY